MSFYCHSKKEKAYKPFVYGVCRHIEFIFALFKLGLYRAWLKHIGLGFVCFYLLIYLYYIICIILLISCCHSVATDFLVQSIIDINHRGKSLQSYFFLPLIQSVFEHEHIQLIQLRPPIHIFDMCLCF